MKTLKKLGIIALTALIVLGVFACDGGDGDYTFEGKVTVSNASDPLGNTFYAGEKVKAMFVPEAGSSEDGRGNSAVEYEWFKGSDKVSPDLLSTDGAGKNNTLTPKEAGVYKARAYSLSEDSLYIESDPFTVTIHTLSDYFGTWKLDLTDPVNKAWTDNQTLKDVVETIVITRNKFRIDSTLSGEYFDFTITASEQFTPTPVNSGTVITSGGNNFEFKTNGVTLTGTLTQNGYSNWAQTSGSNKTFNLFLNADKTKFSTNGHTSAPTARAFTKQP